jgi:hypothetical protein
MSTQTRTPTDGELLKLGAQALADSELYIAHIDGLFASSVERLRGGSDQQGLQLFSLAVADLEQFLQLTNHLRAAARPARATELDAFQRTLGVAAERLYRALASDELVAMSDEIEHTVLGTFARWPNAAAELQSGLSSQLAAASPAL